MLRLRVIRMFFWAGYGRRGGKRGALHDGDIYMKKMYELGVTSAASIYQNLLPLSLLSPPLTLP